MDKLPNDDEPGSIPENCRVGALASKRLWVTDRILRSGRQRQGIIASRVGVEPGLPELFEATTRMDATQGQDVFGTWLTVGSENLIRPQIVNLQRLAAELLPPVFRDLAQSNAA
jgi:hypothetical protein